MILTIKLNGVEEKDSLRHDLTQNPFPNYNWAIVNELLEDLETNPIKDTDDLRDRLDGCSEEFIEGCCERFEKGKMLIFNITFPDR